MRNNPFGAEAHRSSARALDKHSSIYLAMQAGLRRPETATSWSAVSSGAIVVMTPDGRPIRNPITGRKAQVTGIYTSRKAGRPLVHESMNEHAFFQHSEVDTSVADYFSQPCRFEFVADGVKRTYIPDCARLLGNGRIEVVELKSDSRAMRDPDYALKLRWVEAICQANGWTFRIVYGRPLRARSVINSNVRHVQQNRFASYASRDTYAVREFLATKAEGKEALGRVAELLGDRRTGRAQLCAMMVGRQIEIDLAGPLSDDSLVATCGQSSLVEVAQ
jgi:1,2-phenylacetyl-CoA epoxidase PaaB subunit